jgi:CMP/dCMP kinase
VIITIDGPSASGKSTAAQFLAKELGYYYLNSGLLYRALAYLLLTQRHYNRYELNHPRSHDLKLFADPDKLYYSYDADTGSSIAFEGKNITPFLKEPEVDIAASILSTHEEVRTAMHQLQHAIAKEHCLVVEGRDAGSVVFPHASCKFFLTAAVQTRAKRWRAQQEKKGKTYSLEQAIEHIDTRDERDRSREVAPFIIPFDAIMLDNSKLTIDQTVAQMKHEIAAGLSKSEQ